LVANSDAADPPLFSSWFHGESSCYHKSNGYQKRIICENEKFSFLLTSQLQFVLNLQLNPKYLGVDFYFTGAC
jgi:hypothetical protein